MRAYVSACLRAGVCMRVYVREACMRVCVIACACANIVIYQCHRHFGVTTTTLTSGLVRLLAGDYDYDDILPLCVCVSYRTVLFID